MATGGGVTGSLVTLAAYGGRPEGIGWLVVAAATVVASALFGVFGRYLGAQMRHSNRGEIVLAAIGLSVVTPLVSFAVLGGRDAYVRAVAAREARDFLDEVKRLGFPQLEGLQPIVVHQGFVGYEASRPASEVVAECERLLLPTWRKTASRGVTSFWTSRGSLDLEVRVIPTSDAERCKVAFETKPADSRPTGPIAPGSPREKRGQARAL